MNIVLFMQGGRWGRQIRAGSYSLCEEKNEVNFDKTMRTQKRECSRLREWNKLVPSVLFWCLLHLGLVDLHYQCFMAQVPGPIKAYRHLYPMRRPRLPCSIPQLMLRFTQQLPQNAYSGCSQKTCSGGELAHRRVSELLSKQHWQSDLG